MLQNSVSQSKGFHDRKTNYHSINAINLMFLLYYLYIIPGTQYSFMGAKVLVFPCLWLVIEDISTSR